MKMAIPGHRPVRTGFEPVLRLFVTSTQTFERAVDQVDAEEDDEDAESETKVRSGDAIRHDRAQAAGDENGDSDDDRGADVNISVTVVLQRRRKTDRR